MTATIDRARITAPVITPAPRPSGILILWLIVPYPLWWALGLGTLIFPILAIGMAISIARHRPALVPPGFTAWLLFLLLVVLSMPLAVLNPPLAMSGSLAGRLPAMALRLALYLAATVLMLYAYNCDPKRLSHDRLIRALGFLFVVTVAGGLVGMLAPTFEFNSVLELALPHSVRTNTLVRAMVHPNAAQLQQVFGYSTPRPAAPFGYTNTWGNNIAILVPFFAVGFVLWRRGWARLIAIAVLAAALVPIIYSLNRGLWIGLGICAALVVLRLLLRGSLAGLAVAVAVLGIGAALVLSTSLGTVIGQRLNSGRSDNVRTFTTEQTLKIVKGSPVIGFGTTRTARGGANSIVVGKSQDCTGCGNPTLGSNGQAFLVLISQGFLGLLCYLAFHLTGVLRLWRRRDPVADAGIAVLLMSLVFLLFYNAVGTSLCIELLAYAAAARYFLTDRETSAQAS